MTNLQRALKRLEQGVLNGTPLVLWNGQGEFPVRPRALRGLAFGPSMGRDLERAIMVCYGRDPKPPQSASAEPDQAPAVSEKSATTKT